MNKYRYFYVNPNGKIELTPNELEELINDAFCEGQENCGHDHKCACECHREEKTPEVDPNANPSSITIKVGDEVDYRKAIEEMTSLLNNKFATMNPNDVFTTLRKELGL